MKSFAASIVIRAPVERIWSLLTDAERYPMWNSTVERIAGRIASDALIRASVDLVQVSEQTAEQAARKEDKRTGNA